MWPAKGFDSSAGGFLNNTTTDFDSPAKKKGGARRAQSVVPVVIRQIRACIDEEFNLFGLPAQILNVVGILRDYEVQSTRASYNIEDHSGSIKAIWWLDGDSESTPNLPAVKEGSYVQVFGSLRTQDGEKVLMVLRMFCVEDANVVTNHLLQVIHARLQAEAMSKNSGVKIRTNHPGAALANSMSMLDEPMDTSSHNNGFNPLQQKLCRVLRENTCPTGIAKQDILSHFTANQHKDVMLCLEFLVSEGHAYTTIDDDHYKSTDAL